MRQKKSRPDSLIKLYNWEVDFDNYLKLDKKTSLVQEYIAANNGNGEMNLETFQNLGRIDPSTTSDTSDTSDTPSRQLESFRGSLHQCVELRRILGNLCQGGTIKDIAPQELRDKNGGRNPTYEQVITRKWGLHQAIPVRAVCLEEGDYCVYYYREFFNEEILRNVEEFVNELYLEENYII
tara:strand:- start:198 stop:740 length:543 start_codon:yes stop_codon:yes gene_type:complete